MRFVFFILIFGFTFIQSIKLRDLVCTVYKCQINYSNVDCPCVFGDIASFNKHLEEQHRSGQFCNNCGYSLGHQNECKHCKKLYSCKICDSIFELKDLLNHMRIHGYRKK